MGREVLGRGLAPMGNFEPHLFFFFFYTKYNDIIALDRIGRHIHELMRLGVFRMQKVKGAIYLLYFRVRNGSEFEEYLGYNICCAWTLRLLPFNLGKSVWKWT